MWLVKKMKAIKLYLLQSFTAATTAQNALNFSSMQRRKMLSYSICIASYRVLFITIVEKEAAG